MSLALEMPLIWYSQSCYPIFETIDEAAARASADFCSAWAMEYPLWMRDEHGKFPTRDIPGFGVKSSVFAIAVVSSYLVWTQKKAGCPLPDSPLLQACETGYKTWRFSQNP